MRYVNVNLVWAIPATAAIAVIWGVSALANFYFGASLGTDKVFDALFFTSTTAQIFSSASLASDVLKCVVLFAFVASWAAKAWRPAIVTGSIWVVCTAWSVASAVGFVAINHNTVTDGRGKSVEEWTQLEAQIKNLSERRAQIGAARPEGVVQAEINQLLRMPGVGSCAIVNGPATQKICPQVDKLKIELENAKSAAWLDGRLNELRKEVGESDRITSENPFADLAAGLLGVVATKITTGQALWFALLLELVSGPGLWGIWAAVPKTAQKPQEAALIPEATVTPSTSLPAIPRPRKDALATIAGVDVRKDIGQTGGIVAEASDIDGYTPRPMVGLISQLTPEQQKLLWSYDGPEYLGPADGPGGGGGGTPMSPPSDTEQLPADGDTEPTNVVPLRSDHPTKADLRITKAERREQRKKHKQNSKQHKPHGLVAQWVRECGVRKDTSVEPLDFQQVKRLYEDWCGDRYVHQQPNTLARQIRKEIGLPHSHAVGQRNGSSSLYWIRIDPPATQKKVRAA